MKKELVGNPLELAIVICTYGRRERFFICLNCLISSIYEYGKPVQLILMDNNEKLSLKKSIHSFIKNRKLINLIYIHDSISNQSQLRNKSLPHLNSSVKYILFLDSDIYLSKETLSLCTEYFKKQEGVDALAPPLISYKGGSHAICRERNKINIYTGGQNFIMPNEYDYFKNIRKGPLLFSHMLRGAFFLKKSSLLKNFDLNPWLASFKVWQNVPFFLTLSEINSEYGYLLEPNIIALHDDRPHIDTLSASMEDWKSETLKSMILMLFRNKLWIKQHKTKNKRFIDNIIKTIESLGLNDQTISMLFKIAEVLQLDKTALEAKLTLLKKEVVDNVLKRSIDLLLLINYRELKRIKSRNINNII